MAIKITALILISVSAVAFAACSTPHTVRKFIDLWRPNALKYGICEQAITCVRNKMLYAVRCSCLSQDQLGSVHGETTPACFVSNCHKYTS